MRVWHSMKEIERSVAQLSESVAQLEESFHVMIDGSVAHFEDAFHVMGNGVWHSFENSVWHTLLSNGEECGTLTLKTMSVAQSSKSETMRRG